MIDSFSKFFYDLMEMARPIGEGPGTAVPIFDEYDKIYYKYILDHIPPEIKKDEKSVRTVIRQALCFRYGSKVGFGKLAELIEAGKDTLDAEFAVNAGKTKFKIKDIPFNTSQVYEKFRSRIPSYDPNDEAHGYKKAGCNDGTMRKQIDVVLDYFNDGVESEDTGATHYHYKYNSSEAHQKVQVQGAKKHKTREVDPTADRSKEPIPLDADDDKFLMTVEREFNNKYPDLPMYKHVRDDVKDRIKSIALAARYSDRYVIKDEDGKFQPRNPESPIYDDIEIKTRKGTYKLENVYIGTSKLVAKFEKYRLSRDFTSDPLSNLTAERWLSKEDRMHHPHSGSGVTEVLKKPKFYTQIAADHELWRNGRTDGHVDPEVADMVPWRRGGKIVESPNIADDPHAKRDHSEMTWEELLADDVKNAFNSYARFIKSKTKSDFINKLLVDNRDDLEQHALLALTVLRTGSTGYRSEMQRKKMALQTMDSEFRKIRIQADRGGGKEGDDKMSFLGTATSSGRTGDDELPNIDQMTQPDFDEVPEAPVIAAKAVPEEMPTFTAPVDSPRVQTTDVNIPPRIALQLRGKTPAEREEILRKWRAGQ